MKKFLISLLCLLCSFSSYAYDWEHVSLSGGGDIIANYTWRGFAQGGVSFQPWVEFSAYGVTVGTWASVGSGVYSDFCQFISEIDIYLSYTTPGDWVTAVITHYYYFGGEKYFNFAYDKSIAGSTQDEVELTIRPLMLLEENNGLELGAAVMIGGGDYFSGNGEEIEKDANTYKKLYSTYVYMRYTHEIENWIIESELGFSPNPSMYTYYDPVKKKHESFALNNLACSVNYSFFDNDIVNMYVSAGIRFNLFDVGCEKFAYGKNFGWNLGFGFEL
jgi:hypothetical protein